MQRRLFSAVDQMFRLSQPQMNSAGEDTRRYIRRPSEKDQSFAALILFDCNNLSGERGIV
jgi:hypothetical protein